MPSPPLPNAVSGKMRAVWWWAAGILLFAASLRLAHLDARPFHADEAVLADKFGTLLQQGTYRYDPTDYHGPALLYLTYLSTYVSGKRTYQELSEVQLRAVTAFLGIAVTLLPFALRSVTGDPAAIAASALLAASPMQVYYARFYIPEVLLAFCTFLFLILVLRASQGGIRHWGMAGAAAGSMLLTKETAVIALACALLSFAIAMRRLPPWRGVCAFAAGLAPFLLLLGPLTFAGSLLTNLTRATSANPHTHPWHFYLVNFAGLGMDSSDLPVLVLGAFGLALPANRDVKFLQWFSVTLALSYSLIPYKTPWCALSIGMALALPAGIAAAAVIRRGGATANAAFAAVILFSSWQAWRASIPLATSPNNQWAYAQTLPSVNRIVARIHKLAESSPDGHSTVIGVWSPENLWPLPWYLRKFQNVRWSRTVPPTVPPPPILLTSPSMEQAVTRKLYEEPPPGQRPLYVPAFDEHLELRPRVEIILYVVQSLADRCQCD